MQLNYENDNQKVYFCCYSAHLAFLVTAAAGINRLGVLLREFLKLEHRTLYWTSDDGRLDI